MIEYIKLLSGWVKRVFRYKHSSFKVAPSALGSNYLDVYRFSKIVFLQDLPVILTPKTIYVIGVKGYEWMIGFSCPCGCGDTIQLNLLKDGDPKWRYKISKDGNISITPSINRQINCYSHFIITDSYVKWILF